MKIPTSRRECGFTLIELLVVIVIIAVLATAGFSAGAAAIQRAKKVTCQASASALESAVNNFFTEYGSMPTTTTSSGEDDGSPVDTSTSAELLDILLGFDTDVNTRGIKFLNVKQSKNEADDKAPKDGLVQLTDKSAKGLYDPWGGGFFVLMDLNFDEKLEPTPAASDGKKITLYGKRVAVWSNGADAVKGTGGKVVDDVKTW